VSDDRAAGAAAAAAGAAPKTIRGPGTDQTSVAEWLARHLHDRARWVPELGGWAWREPGSGWRWQIGSVADARVRNAVTVMVLAHARTVGGRAGATMRAGRWIAQVEAGVWQRFAHMHRPLSEWDHDAHVLQTPGGVSDLRYGRLRPTGLSDFNLKCTLVTPVAGACIAIDRFLNESFRGDAKLIEFLETFYGVALRGNCEAQQALMLVGEGRSGKSTLVALMSRVAGSYATKLSDNAFVDTTYDNGRDYAMAVLAGARLAVASEVRPGAVLDDAAFKRLVGGDEVSARHPGGRPFKFQPVATTVIAMNEMPRLRSGGEAMRRRMLVVTMNHAVVTEDSDLLAKMLVEAPHWLDRCIQRARFQYVNGPVAVPASVVANVETVTDGVDLVAAWWKDCGETTGMGGDRLWAADVHGQIRAWAHATGREAVDATDRELLFRFMQFIDRQSNGLLGKSSRVQSGNERKQAFIGLRLTRVMPTNVGFGGL
jgi:putative DNA primase/helicase